MNIGFADVAKLLLLLFIITNQSFEQMMTPNENSPITLGHHHQLIHTFMPPT